MNDEIQAILDEINIDAINSLMGCGVIVTEPYPDYKLLYANDLFVKMLGYESVDDLMASVGNSAVRIVDEMDIEKISPTDVSISLSNSYEINCRLKRKDGKATAVIQRFFRKVLKNGGEVIISAYRKADLQNEDKKLRLALANSDLIVWECDFVERKNIYTEETSKKLNIPTVIENVPDGLISTGIIHTDSIEKLRALYRDVMSGKPHAEGVICVNHSTGRKWFKLSMTTVYSTNGMPQSAVCTAIDVSHEEMMTLQIEDEVARRKAYETNLRGKGYYDLTDDRIIEYDTRHLIGDVFHGLHRYTEVVETVSTQISDPSEKEGFKQLFDYKNLCKMYENGIAETNYEYQRDVPEGGASWVKTHIRLMRQPSTQHIAAFMYTTDINSRKQTQIVLNAVAKDSYDGIILVNAETGAYNSFTQKEREILKIPLSGENYWKDLHKTLKESLSEKDYKEAQKTRTPEYVKSILEKEKQCIFISTLKGNNGNAKIMKMQYSYLDSNKQDILVTGMDITEAVQEEKMQKEALESALLAAKQASSAKSSFLSRMSHEIRTPLNAILGMTALAAQANGNETEIQDCISKIGISGHFLLSLVNDILDMSRIESGKMLLRNEAFNFAEFIESITTVIYGQTAQKGINYETIVSHGLYDGYIGDVMKLQQVLVNILGNAVKFTSSGGKITFSVSMISHDVNTAVLRFAINDTGCGIPEESLQRIFEPFEQQDGSTTTVYGGTGLGLAISKSLVELMGGTIHVRSIVDVGSEFTVEVPLTIDQRLVKKHPIQYSFADLRTLIVDDDILVCEQTSKTLKDIGMIPEWVTSGPQAIEKVTELWNKHQRYDFILVDWKMPEMNGIETSRRIRRIVGPDVTIIIITAYDWVTIEHEAKAAGVNMCISKPMLKSTLVSAFSKATGEAEQEKMANVEPEFDFTGRRILLAEDHPLNAEIASRLLEKKGFTVDVAENGLKALERFTATPVGHYDAILMDIRMPIMDGLQSATNIRHWDKQDAKSIPIIAMTANAFDEDVDKSKAAGMDAHLAKPIDPALLYRVLYRLIN